jgi:hypothetical protein
MALSAHDRDSANHIWAGDAGQIAAGKAGEVFICLKQARKSLTTLAAMRQ